MPDSDWSTLLVCVGVFCFLPDVSGMSEAAGTSLVSSLAQFANSSPCSDALSTLESSSSRLLGAFPG